MASAGYSYYEYGIEEAAKSASISTVFILAPFALTFTGIPYAGLAYTTVMTIYSSVGFLTNTASLYNNINSEDAQSRSKEAYDELYEKCYSVITWLSDENPEQNKYRADTEAAVESEIEQDLSTKIHSMPLLQ